MQTATACTQPDRASIAAAFDLAAGGLLPPGYPQLATDSSPRVVPASLLKAVGWVESGWRQFTPTGRPLVSFDFGYGIMQITSGMAGAFGSPSGSIDPATQQKVATDYRFNIAYGAHMLALKWASAPIIGDGDPTAVEDWYYALWAYNGWGWVNNPNNPRFSRQGTPASDPANFPYQERVLYLVAHPPKDVEGRPLWPAVPVTLPAKKTIGNIPQTFQPKKLHRQPPAAFSAIYQASPPSVVLAGRSIPVTVRVTNTGSSTWKATGTSAVTLTYGIITSTGNPFVPTGPGSPGVLLYGQTPAPLHGDTPPGATTSFHITVTAPRASGDYWLVWDLQTAQKSFSASGTLPGANRLHVGTPSPPVVTPTPTVTPIAVPAEGAEFVADTSIPDGTHVPASTAIVKGWLLYNNGRKAWTSAWSLHQIHGKHLGVDNLPLPATPPCHTADLLISLKTPPQSGRYTLVWRLVDPSGRSVGDRVTAVFVVPGSVPRTPTPTPSPSATAPGGGPRPTPTPTTTPIG